jgi:hypothetical protein
MPCYDPPPPYEQRQRNHVERAVRLLCSLVGPRLRAGDETLTADLLAWFIEHRCIDIEIERDEAGRCARHPSQQVIGQAEKDIALAWRQLGGQTDQEQADDLQAICDALADQERADG